MKYATRCLLFLVVASCTLLFTFAPRSELLEETGKQNIQARAIGDPLASSSAPPTSSAAPSSAPASQTSSSTPASSTSAATSSQPTSAPQSSTTPSGSSSAPSSAPGESSIGTVVTGSNGETFTSVVVASPSTSPSPTTSGTSSGSGSGSSSGLGTGSIIGLSVAGGVAVIAIVSFFIWKLTRKRFSDFEDNEAIKWPELNTHGGDVHPLPTHSTGRSGFGTENDSELNLARASSPSGYAHSVAASSVPDVYSGGQDPYAVPPLPHLNPNQPYHDEPAGYGQPGYYDPYRGPVPNTFGDGYSDAGHGAEAFPMTQMARTRSPGPQALYDSPGRGSPGPQAALGYGGPMDGRMGSPAPSQMGARRPSPGPQGAYGYGQR
ncbi:hypothetical protein BJ138DRAFT_1058795 [Hygrophoropsis aurantiaca]|uniref:Uncharacterized protein n=1 Tax=Hygrophoropsis aurantiaca TaxID=72124 RepID=A0ACB8AKR0_9AGAM|nr:hypothetical protein BJ138DRAFT_1058795 [Hygrophoropsis aurantiaca]